MAFMAVPTENPVRRPQPRNHGLQMHRSAGRFDVQPPSNDDAQMPDFALLVNLLQLEVNDRTQLAIENIALRHQPK